MYVLIREVLNSKGNQFGTNINTGTRQGQLTTRSTKARGSASVHDLHGQKRRGERLSILAQGSDMKKDGAASSGASHGCEIIEQVITDLALEIGG
jgi:hypothetical protein